MSASHLMLGDTIAAIATAPGEAGLAVLRVSGPEALAIADRVFVGAGGAGGAGGAVGAGRLGRAPSHTLHHGWAVWPASGAGAAGGPERGTWLDGVSDDGAMDDGAEGAAAWQRDVAPGERLDEVVAALFRAPRSYTREDVVELSCHGGARSAHRLLAALLASGARLARPGEFTLRAFLNGRLDLAEAEAVADLIHASTDAAHRLALSQLAGTLSRELAAVRERLADAVAEVEARVDFAEDVGGIEVPEQVIAAIAGVEDELARLLDGVAWARAVREGVRVPIVGRPNVGKSSLFNALIGEERSIVTALPGTTRDRVSESLELDGVRVTLSDTAGLREDAGPIEAIGVARARETLADSPLALWVVDGSAALHGEDRTIAGALTGKPVLVAINKADRAAAIDEGVVLGALGGGTPRAVRVSALTGMGIPALRGELSRLLGGGGGGTRLGAATGNPRHAEALGRARAALGRARERARSALPGEIVALELREALAAIGEVTGDAVGEDILTRIFSRFCVGK